MTKHASTELVDARGRKYLTAEERTRFLAAVRAHPKPSVQTLARTLAMTGCRVSEAPLRDHTTYATWLIQSGADRWSVAGYLGMTVSILERVYGHHHPDFMRSAVAALDRKPERSCATAQIRAV